jgi:hypothetical protein
LISFTLNRTSGLQRVPHQARFLFTLNQDYSC